MRPIVIREDALGVGGTLQRGALLGGFLVVFRSVRGQFPGTVVEDPPELIPTVQVSSVGQLVRLVRVILAVVLRGAKQARFYVVVQEGLEILEML